MKLRNPFSTGSIDTTAEVLSDVAETVTHPTRRRTRVEMHAARLEAKEILLGKKAIETQRLFEYTFAYKNGSTCPQIARRAGVSASSVRSLMKRHGVPLFTGRQTGERKAKRLRALKVRSVLKATTASVVHELE